jgi:hypothetical protein
LLSGPFPDLINFGDQVFKFGYPIVSNSIEQFSGGDDIHLQQTPSTDRMDQAATTGHDSVHKPEHPEIRQQLR